VVNVTFDVLVHMRNWLFWVLVILCTCEMVKQVIDIYGLIVGNGETGYFGFLSFLKKD
jgi:hypothetical protein